MVISQTKLESRHGKKLSPKPHHQGVNHGAPHTQTWPLGHPVPAFAARCLARKLVRPGIGQQTKLTRNTSGFPRVTQAGCPHALPGVKGALERPIR
jgi:hypothetical protein